MPNTIGKLEGELEDIVLLDLNTGLSQEEILKLQWHQIDLSKKTLTSARAKTARCEFNTRTLPLNETAYNLLKKRVQQNGAAGYVFHDGDGKMIEADNLKKAFKKAVKESGIAHFRFLDLRHTFATWLVQAGVDLYKVSKLMSHKDISTTQR